MEKTGNTEKLKYEFNTASNLEVFMINLNDWYRVTSREFRSFNGKRRINNVEYNGPIYHYATNRRANPIGFWQALGINLLFGILFKTSNSK
jgi:hypothetical protein